MMVTSYDDCFFGGAVDVPKEMCDIAALFQVGRLEEAQDGDQQMATMLYGIYGGGV